MRVILSFQSVGENVDKDKAKVETQSFKGKKKATSITDYLCKWCLTYVGQRRQFCSADCAAQFKICQKRREQRQVG